MPFNKSNKTQLSVDGTIIGDFDNLNFLDGDFIATDIEEDVPNQRIDIDIYRSVPFTTDDIVEGSNLYFTTERAQDAIGSILTDSSTIDFTYDDIANTITGSVIQTAIDHTQISNVGTNTHAQIDTHIANTSNPHSVTKSQIALGNVENTALSTWAGSTSLTTLGTISAGIIPVARLSGNIPINQGGTNLSTTPTNGQVLVGNGTGFSVTSLTGNGAFSFTPGSGTLQINFNYPLSVYFDDDGGSPGTSPSAVGSKSITIGDGASVSAGSHSYAIGSHSLSNYVNGRCLSVGSGVKTSSGTAQTKTTGSLSVAIGVTSASSSGNATIESVNDHSIIIGSTSSSSASNNSIKSNGNFAVAIGQSTSGDAVSLSQSVVIGTNASTLGVNSVAIGKDAEASNVNIGSDSTSSGLFNIGSSTTSETRGSTIGASANCVGVFATDGALDGVAIGASASTALGHHWCVGQGHQEMTISSTTAEGNTYTLIFGGITGEGTNNVVLKEGGFSTSPGNSTALKTAKTIWLLDIYVTGRSTDGTSGAYQISALIKTTDGSTNLTVIGSTVTVVGEDDASWNCTFAAGSGSNFEITCTSHSTSVKTFWYATAKTTEIKVD